MSTSRDERQKLCIKKWVEAKGRATIVGATGFGKTRIATNIIGLFIKKYPNIRILIVVPTLLLKEQWAQIIDDLGYTFNCDIQVINTIITKNWKCDLLVIDIILSI